MADEKLSLDKLLDRYDDKQKARTAGIKKREQERDSFLAEFMDIREKLIRPVFEEIGTQLNMRGHRFSIDSKDYYPENSGSDNRAEITIRLYFGNGQSSRYMNHDYPFLSFIAQQFQHTVVLHASNMTPGHGGSSGPRGTYKIGDITKDLVGRELLHLISEVVDK